jgi:hypothetical protein
MTCESRRAKKQVHPHNESWDVDLKRELSRAEGRRAWRGKPWFFKLPKEEVADGRFVPVPRSITCRFLNFSRLAPDGFGSIAGVRPRKAERATANRGHTGTILPSRSTKPRSVMGGSPPGQYF